MNHDAAVSPAKARIAQRNPVRKGVSRRSASVFGFMLGFQGIRYFYSTSCDRRSSFPVRPGRIWKECFADKIGWGLRRGAPVSRWP